MTWMLRGLNKYIFAPDTFLHVVILGMGVGAARSHGRPDCTGKASPNGFS
jgi:hypothetical protein